MSGPTTTGSDDVPPDAIDAPASGVAESSSDGTAERIFDGSRFGVFVRLSMCLPIA